MKFVTNRISTGKSSSFGDFVQKLASSNAALNKTASSEEVTKKANIANFGDKKANPFGKKEADPAKKDEKETSDKKDEKEACAATSEKEVKVAKETCKENKDGECHVEKQEMDPVGGTNTGKPGGEKKKASNSDVDAANKGVTHKVDECCGAPTSKSDDGSEGAKSSKSEPKSEPKSESKEEPKSESKEEKKASCRFVRIANLDSKTKNDWKKYWKNLYPSEYVDAMFADR